MRSMKPKFYLLAFFLFIGPVLILILQSFSEVWRYQSGEGLTFNLQSYRILLSDPNIVEATLWSLAIGVTVLLFNLLIGLLSGKALALYSFKGRSFLEALFLAPILVPVLAVAMGLHLFMIRIGLADTWMGVVLIHLVPTVPYSIKIFHNTYNQLGHDILEQATILGATSFKQLLTIELPLLKPAIRSVTFLTIVISLSQYATTAIIGGGRIITLPMIFFPFLNTANASLMAAFSIWFALLPFFMYTVVELVLLLFPYTRKPWRN
ncbi:ABC transporter permease [Halobacillus amylolyticus]|uniref:ABC transporter permease subunit n=1 Tax=Halobacillus amylolyticus TaxID=2932259 RepID=A0ABY4HAC4_9BACI|nr:ABC transporter permease subunit [Halobacillus amylolyticus]UOR10355.1 ABC transporter permease subunit [Halobacillus amylolyticus]